MKTCAFYTLGCKVNQYETQAIRENFIDAGFQEVKFSEEADIYIINTCTVTAKTDKESRRLIRETRKRNPFGQIVVTGCYAELDGDEIKSTAGASTIVKNRYKDKIVEIINSKKRLFEQYADRKYLPFAISDFKNRTKAFLKVQDGCNNFCSYCKVPLVRGRSVTRDIKSTIAEMERLVSRGFKEIVLTGICLGAWGEDASPKSSLNELLERLIRVEGDFRIRLSSIEPKYVNAGLVSIINASPKLCRHLHIPLQSGNDEILKKMNRPYTGRGYLDIVWMIRNRIPELSITTDVMVGFPGETEANFRNTYNLIREIRPSRIHIFSYSKRKGTAAQDLSDEVPKDIVKGRLNRLSNLASEISYDYRKKFLERQTKVLVEHQRDKWTGLLKGYDDKYIKILIKGHDDYMSRIIPVRIEKVELHHTLGVII